MIALSRKGVIAPEAARADQRIDSSARIEGFSFALAGRR
jgi:hypothetical protein